MSDTERLLEIIEDGINTHGEDLGGWTLREEGRLQLFDGRVSLRAELREFEPPSPGVVHMHVIATLHDQDDEELDACLMGMGDTREQALAEAGLIWITGVAGPIRSFIDGRPVCLTCQAGVADADVSQGYVAGDYGLTGLQAFVGPSFGRFIKDEQLQSAMNDTKPWFQFAAESAAPRRVHIAKATVLSNGNVGWSRSLEVDGHEVSHHDPVWDVGLEPPRQSGYLVRFAVFAFPQDSGEIVRRAELERAMKFFVDHYEDYESITDLQEEMERLGFDADLVHEVESISTIAFGRALFEGSGLQYSPTIIRARRDGQVERDVPLMSLPAYTRARVLAEKLRATWPPEKFQALACYNAESRAILSALESEGDKLDLSQLTMFPCVVPDRGVSNQTMEQALAVLQEYSEQRRREAKRRARAKKKPWWKFW